MRITKLNLANCRVIIIIYLGDLPRKNVDVMAEAVEEAGAEAKKNKKKDKKKRKLENGDSTMDRLFHFN